MIDHVERRALALFLATLMVLFLFPVTAFAAGSRTETGAIGDIGWSASIPTENGGSPDLGSVNVDGTTMTITAKAEAVENCGDWSHNQTTTVVTFTNNSDTAAVIGFDYDGAVEIDNVEYAAAGHYDSAKLAKNDTVKVTLRSPESGEDKIGGGDVETRVLYNIKWTANVSRNMKVKAGVNGTVKVAGTAISADKTQSVQYSAGLDVSAEPASGYKFLAWVDGNDNVLATTASANIKPEYENVVVSAKFVPTSENGHWIGNKQIFTDFQDALDAAEAGDKQVKLIDKATLTKSHVIPAGVSVLIPHNKELAAYGENPVAIERPNGTLAAPQAYATLTMGEGVILTVNGSLELAAQHYVAHGGKYDGGRVIDYYGFIDMKNNSKINIQSGGKLFAWGYISGSGSVEAFPGSTVYEKFQISDYRGGGITSVIVPAGVFPFNQYYVQNVEVPETIHGGATLICHAGIYGSEVITSSIEFIGANGMFKVGAGAKATKRYDAASDRLIIDVEGEVELNPISLMGYNTAIFVLPINNNITVNVISGKTTVNQDIMMQPGAEVNVAREAYMMVASGKKIYLMDSSDWGNYCMGAQFRPIYYTVANGTAVKRSTLSDAKVNINGTAVVQGQLYASTNGALIESAGKTGVVILMNSAPSGTTNIKQSAATGYGSGMTTNISVGAAILTNGDGITTVNTKGASQYTTYVYDTILDEWVTTAISIAPTLAYDANGGNNAPSAVNINFRNTGLAFQPLSVMIKEGESISREGYTFIGWATTKEATAPNVEIGSYITISEDKTLYAIWNPEVYTVKWADGEGNIIETDTNVNYNSKPSFDRENPTKDGYVFVGWKLEGTNDDTAVEEENLSNITGVTTFVAVFREAEKYTVTFLDEKGNVLKDAEEKECIYEYAEGETVTATYPVYTKPNYTITWSAEIPETLTGDVEIGAIATPNAYTIIFMNGNTEVSADAANEGNNWTVPAIGKGTITPSGESHCKDNFLGWVTENNVTYKENSEIIATGDMVLYAAWGGHTEGNEVIENKAEATCTADGSYETVVYCTECDKELSRVKTTVPALGHTNGTPVVEKEVQATCGADGSYDTVVYCSVCGTELSRTPVTVPATGDHVYVPGEYVWSESHDTCSVTGTCECGATATATATIGSKITTPATCEGVGTTTYTATFTETWATTQTKEVQDIPVKNHAWSVTYNFAEDGKSCTATRICGNDAEHNVTATATVTSKVKEDATCEGKGTTTYTATFNVDWAETKTKDVVDISAKNHAWTVEYNFAEDGKSCTATHVCGNDAEHNVTATATITSKVKEDATCEGKGWTTYTATFAETWAETQTKDVEDIPAKEHAWTVTYNFAEDGKSCTATRICGNDAKHNVTATATITSKVKEDATCEGKGTTTYTATFTETWAETQTKEVEDIPVKGHKYGEAVFTWDVNKATAKFTCSNDSSHVETVTVEGTIEDSTAGDCTKKGTTTYKATVEFNEKTYTATNVVEGAFGEHAWSVTYNFAADGSTCTATHVCGNDESHNATATATITSKVKEDATCEEEGTTLYTAIFAETWAKTQTKEVKDIPSPGHSAGEEVTENNVDPDCENSGSYDTVVYCSVCSAELSRENTVVPKKGHTAGEEVTENETAPDCVNKGSYDTVVYCTVCGEELSRVTTPVDALGHTDGSPVTENEVPATCTTDGSYDTVVYCTVCDAEVSRVTTPVSAFGHTDGNPVTENNVDPDCENPGSYETVVYCTVCDGELSRVKTTVPKLGHKEETIPAKAPDCENTGLSEGKKCTVCGKTTVEQETLPELGHTNGNPVIENNVDPDCVNDGSYDTVIYCSVCSAELSRIPETVSALGHTEGEAKTENLVGATCGTEGSYDSVVYCSVCSAELSRTPVTVPATGDHRYVSEVENVAATCTTDGYVIKACSCGATDRTDIPSSGHTNGSPVTENNVDPDCENSGSYDTVIYCSVCSAELSRINTVVPKNGHTEVIDKAVEPTCSETGLTEGSHCGVCGKTIVGQETVPVIEHTWKEATCDGPKKCEKCGETEGEALEHDWVINGKPVDNNDGMTHTEYYVCENNDKHTKEDKNVAHAYDATTHVCACDAVENFVLTVEVGSAIYTYKVPYGAKIADYLTVEKLGFDVSAIKIWDNDPDSTTKGYFTYEGWYLDGYFVTDEIITEDTYIDAIPCLTGWEISETEDGQTVVQYFEDGVVASGWREIGEDEYLENGDADSKAWYYFDEENYEDRTEGFAIVPDKDGSGIDKLYEFTEDGKLVGVVNGVYEDKDELIGEFVPESGMHGTEYHTYFIENGSLEPVSGLVRVVKEDGEVNYYYFNAANGGKAIKGGATDADGNEVNRYWINLTNEECEETGFVTWAYTFGKDGVIEHFEDTSLNGIYNDGTTLWYVIDGVKIHKGLFVVDGYYYYAKSSGALAVSEDYWVSGDFINGVTYPDGTEFKAGSYRFDEKGRIVFESDKTKNGVYAENGSLYYYVDGERTYAGLIIVSGDIYDESGEVLYEGVYSDSMIYANTYGEVKNNCSYWISKNNGLVAKNRSFDFDEYGRASVPGKLSGVVKEADGNLYYYVEGTRYYAGLVEYSGDVRDVNGKVVESGIYDNDIIYVNTSGKVVVNSNYWVSKNNGLIAKNCAFDFDEYGRVYTPEVDEEITGVVKEGDKLYYYVDGERSYEGLVLYSGHIYDVDGNIIEENVYNNDYIYVKTSCEVVAGQSYWISKNNGLMKNKMYDFDANGAMTNPAPLA